MTNFYCWSLEYSEIESGEFTVKYFSKAIQKVRKVKLTRFFEELDIAFGSGEPCDIVLVELGDELPLVELF